MVLLGYWFQLLCTSTYFVLTYQLFLITNSAFRFVDAGMRYLLRDYLSVQNIKVRPFSNFHLPLVQFATAR